jgi:hypothetical protein
LGNEAEVGKGKLEAARGSTCLIYGSN